MIAMGCFQWRIRQQYIYVYLRCVSIDDDKRLTIWRFDDLTNEQYVVGFIWETESSESESSMRLIKIHFWIADFWRGCFNMLLLLFAFVCCISNTNIFFLCHCFCWFFIGVDCGLGHRNNFNIDVWPFCKNQQKINPALFNALRPTISSKKLRFAHGISCQIDGRNFCWYFILHIQ